MAKYMTPDFDVTVYEIKDRITAIVDTDPDFDGLLSMPPIDTDDSEIF